jgi:Uma2 family endonuclease
LQPDLVVTETRQFTTAGLTVPPLLAVEVLSPSTRLVDLHLKRVLFEREGTPSFWLVEPSARPAEARLEVWQLTDVGRYEQVADVMGEKVYEASLPYPVTVCPADLVRDR